MARVLLLDDNPAQLKFRELLFREAGIECIVADDSREALSLLENDVQRLTVGAVLTDHTMPRMSGPEFVGRLRAIDAALPVIVLSGQPGVAREYDGLQVTFRQKPCEPEDLLNLVARALGNDAKEP
jgi:DNA-binding NtrC family response regulator